ncbi:DHA1 family bicyclomycin/chloramphenicol resistance-like MFS transporter [Microvirga flocculans]|uniref:Bcr/CflA family efflux transporter n=1 Tax=Microvirga flocculans TaxID=217168 RepID=A0A7W6IBQ6_9HYPH|nr:multidrug effflux MFS transporter [Microvirga flocculans]MBB4038526.1 DHA1 family bicyclomycin/chloramphenicol resistance-like MFS transporter [Microvirga flocculans]
MKSAFLRNALVLGMLSAVGPFAIDTYLPAFPAIARELQVDVSAVQMSLMSFFVAVALCQLAYGPLSDRFGRKPPLYFGLGLFVLAGIGCSFAPNVETLIAFRFLQGVGSCAAMVIPRAVIRDLHTGHEAARLMATTMLVFSVSPILAPLAGSALTAFFGWRVIFWAVAAIGLAGLAVVLFLLPETHRPASDRKGIAQAFATYRALLRDRRFLSLAFIGGFSQASFFAYLAGSSVIFIEHFGLTPSQYSMVFASNAIAFIGSAQFNSTLMRRFGAERVVRVAISVFAALVTSLFLLTVIGIDRAYVLWGLLFVSFGCLGLVIPSTAVLALEEHGPVAGTASALMGTLQLSTGAVMIVLVSAFYDGTPLSMVSAIVICGLMALALSIRTMKAKRAYP